MPAQAAFIVGNWIVAPEKSMNNKTGQRLNDDT